MDYPLFSILIAHYNNAHFLGECLESVLEQTYKNIEVVLVDDGSTDNWEEVVDGYRQKGLSIQVYFNNVNKGIGYTKRKCVEVANGEICGFLDPDDAITPSAVHEMVLSHQENMDVALIYSNLFRCDEKMQVQSIQYGTQVAQGDTLFLNELGEISCFATFKKSFYNKTSGINGYLKRSEDQDLYLKLYEVGECLHIPQTLYRYRVHQGGISNGADPKESTYWSWKVWTDRAERLDIDLSTKFSETLTKSEHVKFLVEMLSHARRSRSYKWAKKSGLIKLVKERFKG